MPNTLYVGPEYSPENGNITDPNSRGRFLAKFRDYGNFGATSSSPSISVARTANGLTITFTGTLQSATSILGPWTPVTGTSPLVVPTTGSAQFFRVQ